MGRATRRSAVTLAVLLSPVFLGATTCRGSRPAVPSNRDRLPSQIDRSVVGPIAGTEHPLATAEADCGRLPAETPLDLSLAVHLSPAEIADRDVLLAAQRNPASPLFQKWLTPEEYGERFGLTDHDLDQLTIWLASEGFTVTRVGRGRTHVWFTGSVGQAEHAFHTELHRYQVNGETHFANSTALSVPRPLDEVVADVRGLNDFHPKRRPLVRANSGLTPNYNAFGTTALVPSDLVTIYDIQKLYDAGYDGTGVRVGVVEPGYYYPSDLTAFRSNSGLPSTTVDDEFEAGSGSSTYMEYDPAEEELDIEWIGAIAKNATLVYIYTGSASHDAFDALIYGIDQDLAQVVSVSWTSCEGSTGSSTFYALQSDVQQGNAEGMTVLASSGDRGAVECDNSHHSTSTNAYMNVPGTIPEVTAVGGTEFNEGSGSYWNASGNAKSYIPEKVWNDGSSSSSGSGPSHLWSKPSWQTGTGVPADGKRDVPDVAFNASSAHDGYMVCLYEGCQIEWYDSDLSFYVAGGTSVSAPLFASMLGLIVQAQSGLSIGNVNPALYGLAAASPTAFNDVTVGDNVEPCTQGTILCPTTSPYEFGYSATTGYDVATGLGSVDLYNFYKGWMTDTATTLSASPANIDVGDSVTITMTVSPFRSGQTPTGSVTLSQNGTSIGTMTITAGSGYTATASKTLSSLPIGTYTFTATYSGDSTFSGSTATSLTVDVVQALSVSPTSVSLEGTQSQTFVASGGVSPIVWALATNASGGSINSSTGVYTAGSTAGTDVISATDAAGNVVTATASVTTPLSVSPTSLTVVAGGTTAFTTAGGLAPITWTLPTNGSGGSIDQATGVYTAGTTPGTDVVQAVDAYQVIVTVTVTVVAPLVITPATLTLQIGNFYTFTTSGGLAPLTWTLSTDSTGGSIPSAGLYIAGLTPGTDVITVSDALGEAVTATITVNPRLFISPYGSSVVVGGAVQFTTGGGSPPVTWSLKTNNSGGSIDPSTGIYTAGTTAATDTVKAVDTQGNLSTAPVHAVGVLGITPTTAQTVVGYGVTFSTTGGTSPYNWGLSTNQTGGSVDSSGNYTAGSTPGTDIVQVTDGSGQSASASVSANAALTIAPSSTTLIVGDTQPFTTTGGLAPITWSLSQDHSGGSVDTSGNYTAGMAAGNDHVQAVDALGETVSATVVVVDMLTVNPASQDVMVNQTAQFAGVGGKSPYSWLLLTTNTGGSIDPSSGIFTAASTTGTDTVQVTDSLNRTATATITVVPLLTLSPTTLKILPNHTQAFTASGGLGPMTWTIPTNSSGATIDSNGNYTAGPSLGSDLIQVTDSLGDAANASVTVVSAPTITPSSETITQFGYIQFSASGGVTPRVWSLLSDGTNGASIDSSGFYQPGNDTGVDVVEITDAFNQTATATITVVGAPSVSPSSKHIVENTTQQYTASGGLAPYSWKLEVNGSGGSVDSNGLYTAGGTAGSDSIQVKDALGQTANAAVTTVAPLTVSPTSLNIDGLEALSFSHSGGYSPYTWKLETNNSGGSITSGGGYYAAGARAGVDVVQVSDSLGETATATVNVNAELTLSPATSTVAPGTTVDFFSGGGVPPLTWTIKSNNSGGSIDTSGVYTAGATGNKTDTVKVTDSIGGTATATVSVLGPVSISPSSKSLNTGASTTFTASGGSGTGQVWSISTDHSGGNITSAGLYTAGATGGVTDTISVVDSLGYSATATATITQTFVISPVSPPTVAPRGTQSFTSAGGTGNTRWTLTTNSSGGSIVQATGVYTAGATPNVTDVVTAHDMAMHSTTVSVRVGAGVSVSPATATVEAGGQTSLSASGGSGTGFTWSLTTNQSGGSITSGGVYKAGANGNTTDTVQARDSLGNTATATVSVISALAISPSSPTSPPLGGLTFSTTGGQSPVTFSLSTNGSGGSVSSAGDYTAGTTGGTEDVVVATDALGYTSAANVSVSAGVSLVPVLQTVATGSTISFAASGGSGTGFIWSIPTNGSGAMISSSGVYIAGPMTGTEDVVQAVDSLGNSATAFVTVIAPLVLSPTSVSVVPRESVSFTTTGGETPISFRLTTNGSHGTVGIQSGAYQAGSTGHSTDVLSASDAAGEVVTAPITIGPGISLTPPSATVVTGSGIGFVASGGSNMGFTWTLNPGGSGGSISTAGLYTAGSTTGVTDTVEVTDSLGNTATAPVTVVAPVSITPINPTTWVGGSIPFQAHGGSGTGYTWSVPTSASGGAFSGSTYIAGTTADSTDTVSVSDSLGNSASTTVSVVAALSIDQASQEVPPGFAIAFTSTGGSGTVLWSLLQSGSGGSIDPSTGAYSAGRTGSTTDVVEASDQIGEHATVTITIGPGLSLSPASYTTVVNGIVPFSSTGGSNAGYVWTIPTNNSHGTITSAGSYTAGSIANVIDTVQLKDSLGNVAAAPVTVNAALGIQPSSVTLPPRGSQSFTAAGGVPPVSWTVTTGSGGSINGQTGAYEAGATPGTSDVVTATDSEGNQATATITIGPGVSVTQSAQDVTAGGTVTFIAAGGTGTGFVWSIPVNNSHGSIAANGVYTAGAGGFTDTIEAADSLGNTASATVNVHAAPIVTPSAPSTPPLGPISFSVTGGVTPISWTLAVNNSGGSINPITGGYVAGPIPLQTDVVVATDALGGLGTTQVSVGSGVSITPPSKVIAVGDRISFSASGGSGTGFTWSIPTNKSGATLDPAGNYTAGPAPDVTDTVEATDSLGNVATATVSVNPALAVAPATLSLPPQGTQTFTATGGVPPVSWSFTTHTSGGSIDAQTGAYKAGTAASTTDVVIATDSLGNQAIATITIGAGVSVVPATVDVTTRGTFAFSAMGGSGTGFVWTIPVNNSHGTIAANGAYTAGSTGGVADTVQAQDSLGNVGTATIAVHAPPTVSPSQTTAPPLGHVPFSAAGGFPPIAWSLTTNASGGSIDPATGDYTAGPDPLQTDVATATDSLGGIGTAQISVGAGVSISPNAAGAAPEGTVMFAASGGSDRGFLWSIPVNNSGANITSAGVYTAGSTNNVSDTVRVADSLGNAATATVAVSLMLQVTPPSISLPPSGTQSFSSSGGVPPVSWSLGTDGSGGRIDAQSGAYSAGSTGSTSDVVLATDSVGSHASATVAIGAAVSVTPATVNVTTGGTVSFAAAGGSNSGFTWTIPVNNSGAQISGSGTYAAGPLGGDTDTVEATDSLGNVGTALVAVYGPPAISPETPSAPPRGTIAFTVTGGLPPIAWSLTTDDSGGSIDATTGKYAAGPTPSQTDVVTATDSLGASSTAQVSVGAGVSVNPPTAAVTTGGMVAFSASGGSGSGLVWSLPTDASGGMISAQGLYVAGSTGGVDDTVQVADSLGNVSTAIVVVSVGVQADAGTADAGTTDAGVSIDAGAPVDAGAAPDAGVVADAGNMPDAGSEIDAGVFIDAGSPEDAGQVLDAGIGDDAGSELDAGSAQDAGAFASSDAGPPSTPASKAVGCACSAGVGSDAMADMLLIAGAVLAMRRRRTTH
jgi:hypothetical protein